MTYKGLPLISMDILDDMAGIEIISLVDRPAVEREFIAFQEQEVKFSVNEEKHIVTGVALIPDQKIYRNQGGKEFYMVMSREAIERIATKFFADHNSTNVNVMHEVDVDGCVYFESYLTNKERGIYPTEFGELPDGTWIVSCKINNPQVWDLIRKGQLKGFSVEGWLSGSEVKEMANEKPIDTIEELVDYLNNIQ